MHVHTTVQLMMYVMLDQLSILCDLILYLLFNQIDMEVGTTICIYIYTIQ